MLTDALKNYDLVDTFTLVLERNYGWYPPNIIDITGNLLILGIGETLLLTTEDTDRDWLKILKKINSYAKY